MDLRLSNDSFFVKDFSLSELRLFNHSSLLWLTLIPKRDNLVELIDLSLEEQAELLQEISLISKVLKSGFPCDKLNIASLGNVVPQLHVHIIARRKDDPYFPDPPFGCERISYDLRQKDKLIQKIQELLL